MAERQAQPRASHQSGAASSTASTPAASPSPASGELDPHRLLCEACGYDLSTLTLTGPCPECGADRAASSPVHRVGSPWQIRAASPRAWLAEAMHLGLHPHRWRTAFGRVRLNWPESRSLLLTSVTLASALAAIGFSLAGLWLTAVLAVVVGPPLLLALTAIETIGLRMFGRQRSWRITSEVAWVVVAHASPAWVLAGVGAALGAAAGERLLRPVDVFIWSVNGEVSGGVIGFLAGMFAFESVVFFGVRRCRFANRPDAVFGGSPV